MTFTSTFTLILAYVSFFSPAAFALLYPTRPVASTVYKAGKDATILWKDDGVSPHLNELPQMQLELYGPDNVLIQVLDKNIDPSLMKHDVRLSTSLGVNSSGFYMRFHSDKPAYDFYTARFTITGLTGSNGTSAEVAGAAAEVWTNISTSPAASTFLLPSLTLPTAQNLIPTIPLAMPIPSATFISHSTISAHPSPSNAAGNTLFDFDIEAFKFRLVFIIWPALIGISMAL